MDLYEEFFNIANALNKGRIHYALIGGIAMGYYAEPRFTKDIDVLTVESEMAKIGRVLQKLEYEECSQPWTFSKTRMTLHRYVKVEGTRMVTLDILVGNDALHKSIIEKTIKMKSHAGYVNIARKEDLIKLKKIRNSDQDKVDIKRLRAL
ncbi:MAG: nucleotidyltransferase [Chitinispirillaceae bacterium]|nr:nucleotidyltransferase [Chitinispirillaceae bacterium]